MVTRSWGNKGEGGVKKVDCWVLSYTGREIRGSDVLLHSKMTTDKII